MYVALADNYDITRAGMMYVCQGIDQTEMRRAEDKAELIEQLKAHPDAVVVLDYTLFDINDVEELEILYQRFPQVQWILFSVDLSSDFVRRVLAIAPRFSILLKESPLQEIREGNVISGISVSGWQNSYWHHRSIRWRRMCD